MAPLALSSQRGARRPEKAGTKYTPPVSGTDAASSLACSGPSIMHRLSRSHEMPRPATATAPESSGCGGGVAEP